jgi:hypothetical protein
MLQCTAPLLAASFSGGLDPSEKFENSSADIRFPRKKNIFFAGEILVLYNEREPYCTILIRLIRLD